MYTSMKYKTYRRVRKATLSLIENLDFITLSWELLFFCGGEYPFRRLLGANDKKSFLFWLVEIKVAYSVDFVRLEGKQNSCYLRCRATSLRTPFLG